MAMMTMTIPSASTQFRLRLKKITYKIVVTIGCTASMIETTSDGAK